jgi:hypothetical protein
VGTGTQPAALRLGICCGNGRRSQEDSRVSKEDKRKEAVQVATDKAIVRKGQKTKAAIRQAVEDARKKSQENSDDER